MTGYEVYAGYVSLFINVIVLPGVFYCIKIFLPKFIDERVQLQIEEIKHQNKKAEYRYELYTQKQHEVILNLHRMLGETKGMIASMSGLHYTTDFSDFSTRDFEEWYNRQPLKMIDKEYYEILSNLENKDYQKVNELVYTFINQKNYNLTYNKLVETKNYFLKNELYIKKEFCETINDLQFSMTQFYFYYCNPDNKRCNGDDDTKKQIDLREHIDQCYSTITEEFRNYLEKGS